MWSFLRITRNFSITKALETRTARRKHNPGLGFQINELEDAHETIQQDPEGFGDIETDFANVHHMHREHESEMIRRREKIKQYIVKKKYFPSQKLPNFLTYSEKEQIRILHDRDQEQWSVEALAESFPANCEIIHKILKSNWKLYSVKRKEQHDKSVEKNWELLKKGEFNQELPQELRDHLTKFINRRHVEGQTYLPPKIESKPKSKQFSSLLKIGQKEPEPDKKALVAAEQKNPPLPSINDDEETFLLEKVKSKKRIRFEDLDKSLLRTPIEDENINSDLDLIAHKNDLSDTGVVMNTALTFRDKFATNEVVVGQEDIKRYEMSSIKDRVCIPRKLWRKGATYRIDDCYYDDDGEFLYRVPGMTAGSVKKDC